MRQWYVARTKPRKEEQTAVVLTQRGVEVYLPRVARWETSNKGGQVKKLEPLFPGYLFARLDRRTPDWVAARCAPGVVYFLGAENNPSPVPAEVVETIRLQAEHQQEHGWPTRFRRGEPVAICAGPLAGLEAIFDSALSASGRSRVFIEVLNRLVPLVVSARLLRQAS